MKGEIVWFYASDLAFEADRKKAEAAFASGHGYQKFAQLKRAPEGIAIYSPLIIDVRETALAPEQACGKAFRLFSKAKLFQVGAVSVEIRMPFDSLSIEEIGSVRDQCESPSGAVKRLASEIAADVLTRGKSCFTRPHAEPGVFESYSAICISHPEGMEDGAERWLHANRSRIAALLIGETTPESLSDQQIAETIRASYSFNRSDIAVVYWDSMLIVDDPAEYEELLYTVEVSNLQLCELRTHDEMVEHAIERSYLDLDRYGKMPAILGTPSRLARLLREEMMDLARIADEILNLSKFFGDWHLARIYEGLRSRFHLAEWEAQLERKLKVVNSLYGLMEQEVNNRRMLVLEVMIVLLFLADIVFVVLAKL